MMLERGMMGAGGPVPWVWEQHMPKKRETAQRSCGWPGSGEALRSSELSMKGEFLFPTLTPTVIPLPLTCLNLFVKTQSPAGAELGSAAQ